MSVNVIMHRMKPRILTVTLNPAIDKTVKVENFKFGQDSYEDAIFLSAGGKGLNVSRVLKRLGIESIATGFVGGASGDYIKKQLNKEKIKQEQALRDREPLLLFSNNLFFQQVLHLRK